jgi:hypothetical protein
MTNQQTLTKAIEKAIAGGWKFQPFPDNYFPNYLTEHDLAVHVAVTVNDLRLYATIFNHDFARALWYDDIPLLKKRLKEASKAGGGVVMVENAWRYHLKQMVIAENPIEYLGRNI